MSDERVVEVKRELPPEVEKATRTMKDAVAEVEQKLRAKSEILDRRIETIKAQMKELRKAEGELSEKKEKIDEALSFIESYHENVGEITKAFEELDE